MPTNPINEYFVCCVLYKVYGFAPLVMNIRTCSLIESIWMFPKQTANQILFQKYVSKQIVIWAVVPITLSAYRLSAYQPIFFHIGITCIVADSTCGELHHIYSIYCHKLVISVEFCLYMRMSQTGSLILDCFKVTKLGL